MYVIFLYINKVDKKSLSATQTYRKNFGIFGIVFLSFAVYAS